MKAIFYIAWKKVRKASTIFIGSQLHQPGTVFCHLGQSVTLGDRLIQHCPAMQEANNKTSITTK
jgi:hypothetical protein